MGESSWGPAPGGALEQRLFTIFKLHHQNLHAYAGALGLHPGQPPILMKLLDADGCTQRELSNLVNIRPASMTDNLRRMEKAGLIVRRADENDMRMSRVFLTEKGRESVKAVFQMGEALEKLYLNHFTLEERAQLLGFLDRMLDNMRQLESKK